MLRKTLLIFALILIVFIAGCSGHTTGSTATIDAPPTLNGYGGVYLSTQNAWGKSTIIRILAGSPTSVQFVGNTYGSVSDALAVASYSWQPNTGNFVGQVSGSIAYANPHSFTSVIQMSITITDPTDQGDDLPMTTGAVTFGSAPRDPSSTAAWSMTESQPSATWMEIGQVIQ